MIRSIRSELIRLNRPSFLFGGIGLMAFFAVLATVVALSQAGNTGPGPGEFIPAEALVEAKDGFVSGLGLAANVVGIVALAFWAIAVASDYQNGLIRLLVQAEPRRYRLLGGKLVALLAYTLAGTLLATLAASVTAFAIAPALDIATSAWTTDMLASFADGFLRLSLSTIVWGVIGLTIAMITRSSGVAIAVGVGYVMVVEQILLVVVEDASEWLPAAALSALAAGGTPNMDFDTAVALGAAYSLAGIAIAMAIMQRREITY
jgi:hypothetical protein